MVSILLVIITLISVSLAIWTFPTASSLLFIPGLSQENQISQTTAPYKAEEIYRTKSVKADQDVRNLIVFMPSPFIRDQKSMPNNASISAGTTVIFINGQIYTDHGIVLRNEKGEIIFNKPSLPYKNAVAIRFDNPGMYTYSSTDLSTYYGRLMNGTINVNGQRNASAQLSASSDTPTIGLLIVPINQKNYFDKGLSSSGYHIIDSYAFNIPQNLSRNLVKGFNNTDESKAILYVYGIETDKHDTVIKAIDAQLGNLQSRILNP